MKTEELVKWVKLTHYEYPEGIQEIYQREVIQRLRKYDKVIKLFDEIFDLVFKALDIKWK